MVNNLNKAVAFTIGAIGSKLLFTVSLTVANELGSTRTTSLSLRIVLPLEAISLLPSSLILVSIVLPTRFVLYK